MCGTCSITFRFAAPSRRFPPISAEVLVKDRVLPGYIVGAYVKDDTSKTNLENQGFDKEITIKRDVFFR